MALPSMWGDILYEEPARKLGDPRADCAAAFAELVRVSQMTDAEFAEALGLAVGQFIRPSLIRVWCLPTGAKPPAHWLIAAARLVAEHGRRVLGGLVA